MIKAKRYDANYYQIIDTDSGKIMAFASRLTNDRWQVNDTNDVRIEALGTFSTPKDAAYGYAIEFCD